MHRLLVPLLCLTLLVACNEPPRSAPPALTHQWRVPAGGSLFVDVRLGASPDGAADRLMAVMPTVFHRVGEACRERPEVANPGTFSLSFTLDHGAPVNPAAEPKSALAICAIEALPAALRESAGELAGLPPIEIVLLLQHAPG